MKKSYEHRISHPTSLARKYGLDLLYKSTDNQVIINEPKFDDWGTEKINRNSKEFRIK